mgnify:CR=1 FL=1
MHRILYSGRQICIRPYIFSHTEHKEAETERQRVIERERNCLPCIAYFTVVDRLAFVLAFFQIQRDKETETERRRVIERER